MTPRWFFTTFHTHRHSAIALSGTLRQHAHWRRQGVSPSQNPSQTQDFLLLNFDSPTRLPSSGDPISPDLTIASSHIALDLEWRTLTTNLEVLSK